MRSLAIVGPGVLGLSLARHAAERGMTIRLVGRDRAHAENGLQKIVTSWKRRLNEGQLSLDAFRLLTTRLGTSDTPKEAIRDAFALVEALPEDLQLKQTFWNDLAPSWPSDVLPLTGSSSLPASLIHPGAATGCRIQNFHLFVPVHHHPVVELASPSFSTEADRARAKEFAAFLNLQVFSVKECQGLAATRMGLVQGLEAMRLLEDGHASASELDSLMTLGYGHPCGPLELSDRIGLDLRLAIASQLFEATNNPVYWPPKLLKEKVANGELGRKSGKGFFSWTHDGRKA